MWPFNKRKKNKPDAEQPRKEYTIGTKSPAIEWAAIQQNMMRIDDDEYPEIDTKQIKGVYFRTDEESCGKLDDILDELEWGMQMGGLSVGPLRITPSDSEMGNSISELEQYGKDMEGIATPEEREYFSAALRSLKKGFENKDEQGIALGLYKLRHYVDSLDPGYARDDADF